MEIVVAVGERAVRPPTQRQLDAWLREWQKVLRLQDWNVRIECKREREMEHPDCHGLNSYSLALKNATIQVRHSLDFRDAGGFPEDIEATIVHELVHLHFAGFYTDKGLANTLQEQAIEVIAQSLVALKRKGLTMGKKGGSKKSKPAAGSPPPAEKKMPKGGGRGKKCG
jgi:hypothetical protein